MRQIRLLNAATIFCVSNPASFAAAKRQNIAATKKRQTLADNKNEILKYKKTYGEAASISDDKPRRDKKHKDFPCLKVQPTDVNAGPYDDSKSQAQHKFGPYGGIIIPNEQ